MTDENEDERFFRWYGDWAPLSPSTVGEVMDGFHRPWWVIGGWSIEAFTGVARDHDDLDITMFADDAEAFRQFLGDGWTPWRNDGGLLRAFDGPAELDPDGQLWIRRDSRSPWVLDVPLTRATVDPTGQRRWTNKRDHAHAAALEDVTWVAPDGLRYQRPEVTLLMKARLDRPKDRADLAVTLPLLDDSARGWLAEMLAAIHPGHPWIQVIAG